MGRDFPDRLQVCEPEPLSSGSASSVSLSEPSLFTGWGEESTAALQDAEACLQGKA